MISLSLSILFSQSTRYAGFASQLARASDISGIRSQMEPRSPLLSLPIPIRDCRLFFFSRLIAYRMDWVYFAKMRAVGNRDSIIPRNSTTTIEK